MQEKQSEFKGDHLSNEEWIAILRERSHLLPNVLQEAILEMKAEFDERDNQCVARNNRLLEIVETMRKEMTGGAGLTDAGYKGVIVELVSWRDAFVEQQKTIETRRWALFVAAFSVAFSVALAALIRTFGGH